MVACSHCGRGPRAVTRGNGQQGEAVTDNIRTIPTVPLRLRTEVRPAPELPGGASRGRPLIGSLRVSEPAPATSHRRLFTWLASIVGGALLLWLASSRLRLWPEELTIVSPGLLAGALAGCDELLLNRVYEWFTARHDSHDCARLAL